MPTPFSTSAALLDSIGINTHLSYTDTTYGNRPLLLDRVQDLGIRHLRDGMHGGPSASDAQIQTYLAPAVALAKAGCDFLMVHSPADNLEPISATMLNAYWWRYAQAICAIEGWNEANTGQPVGWNQADQQWQQQLYSAVKAMVVAAVAPSLPVLSPSLSYQSQAQFQTDLAALGPVPCDFGNLHAYSGANPPSVPIPTQLSEIAAVSGSRPVWVTECGYNNLLGVYPNAVTETVAAKYTLRTLLWNFMNGVQRTYLYELLDWKADPTNSNVSWHWGLVRADGTAKPAYTAVRGLLRLLQDGHKAVPEGIDYLLTAPSCASLLLQYDDERWLLFIWQEVQSYDPVTKNEIPVAPVSAVLSIGSERSMTVYQPYVQEQPLQMTPTAGPGHVLNLTLSIEDHPTVVLIR